jgi:hypothetical protein
MGLFDKIKSKLFGSEHSESYEEKLAKLGLAIESNELLLERLKEYNLILNEIKEAEALDLRKEPVEVVNSIIDYMSDIGIAIDVLASPWLRSGSRYWSAKIMLAWSELHQRALDIANAVKIMIEEAEKEKIDTWKLREYMQIANVSSAQELQKVLAHLLHHYFLTFYLKYAKYIIALSWFSEDVSPSWSVVVQNPGYASGSSVPPTMVSPETIAELEKLRRDLKLKRRGEKNE